MSDDRSSVSFDEVSYEAWRQTVTADLKGVPFEKRLVSSTFEGISIQPLYTAKDGAGVAGLGSFPGFPPYVRGAKASGYLGQAWDVSQELDFAGLTEFNEAARTSLERGLNALNIVLDQATRNGHDPDWAQPGEVGVGGLSIATLEDLEKALAGIPLEKTSLFIRSGASAMPIAAFLIALARKRGQNAGTLRGCIEMDPLGVLSHEGRLPNTLSAAYREMGLLSEWAIREAPLLQTVCVHTRAWHEGGASAVQELALGLSAGVEYLREMHRRALDVSRMAPRIRWAVTVGESYFMEIAKLRAARLLWSQAVAAMGGDAAAQRLYIHGRTSLRNKTVYDAHVNILRATVEAFAAVVGGCDSLQVGAFDQVLRSPDDFSRRLARNTQLILAHECQLTSYIDPAGGSWYVEKLTMELAERAWAMFQRVEAQGGLAKALEAGVVQSEIAATQAAREASVAQRRTVLVGTNRYPNPQEKMSPGSPARPSVFERRRQDLIARYRTETDHEKSQHVLQRLGQVVAASENDLFEACAAAALEGATLGEVTRSLRIQDAGETRVTPVTLRRLAEPYEILRGAVDAYARQTQTVPSVFLTAMGPPAQHRARAEFSREFFEVAGLHVVTSRGFDTAEAAVQGVLETAPLIAVICSTDETYPDLVPAIAAGIKRINAHILVVVAGYPADHVAAFQQAGVDDFIHLKANAIEVLTRLLAKGGILHA